MEIIEGKKHHHQQQSTKSSRSASPEPAGDVSPFNDDFRPLMRTPPPTRAGPPPSPPVPTHPKAPVAPEPPGPQALSPCLVCGRTFLPPSLAKHIKICEKMTAKKRKTFDSSRQRREGTDLEQYLPKNFGLPENSPFLEKSPPATAKPTAKPKVHSVRQAITKPTADLQKCPHCNRNFGVRAFERHVEWCADKAKILPTAPVQPPQHIADAKQRLNARTQYKAPPVRGRKSSQTRDKSSNSRSASVESSRGISPPREFGDYRRGRIRASESASSHEDTSPHIPVIRNTRVSQNNSSGDANVKARQARLARDLSNTRPAGDPVTSPIQQSNTDPKINKTEPQKPKKRLNVKKLQQLKKLEEIAIKYNQREKEKRDESKSAIRNREKSLIPIPRKSIQKEDDQISIDAEEAKPEKTKSSTAKHSKIHTPECTDDKKPNDYSAPDKPKTRQPKNTKVRISISRREAPVKDAKVEKAEKAKKYKHKETKKNVKEISMSLDSLEDIPDSSRNCHSVGINTELLCVPCVIHENTEPKNSSRKIKTKNITFIEEVEAESTEPSIELLYKNLTMVSSCDIQLGDNFESTDYSVSNSKHSLASNSGLIISDNFESVSNLDQELKSNQNNKQSLKKKEICEIHLSDQKFQEECKSDGVGDLSAENFEENNELDVSNELYDSIEGKSDEAEPGDKKNIGCRYGSGETYTKFTENPDDLEEFMNLTDKLMISNIEKERHELDADVANLHTPKTNSLETLNKESFDEDNNEDSQKKYNFSGTFEDLKSNFKELLVCAGEVVLEKTKAIDKTDDEINKEVNNMEHITVYQLKFYEKEALEEKATSETVEENPKKLKLPSIEDNNKPERKVTCNKKRIQKIYKPKKSYKLLGEQKRASEDFKTFIVKSGEDNSDGQSITSEAPPLKLPRIETKKRLDESYDPFASAARQMKELMSSNTSTMSKKNSHSSKDLSRTLPILRQKDKAPISYNSNNTKLMKDTLNKSYQKTPSLQRMKSFGSTNNDHNTSFGSRCSSFRVHNDKLASQKLNTTFTKSSKENVSTADKSYFNRNSNLNRSFSSYTASSYSTPKPKDKIPKIATSMYHSFQRTTIKQPVKLDKIKRDVDKKDFVSLDAILADDNSSLTDSSYIDPRLINENDNLPINVNTILNNPDIISSMESLLTTENLPAKFESFSSSNLNINNNKNRNGIIESNHKLDKIEQNNNLNRITVPAINHVSAREQYDKIISSMEQSLTSKTSVRDDESLCEDFDLEEFMTTFDEEIIKHKLENKRTCSSTTRVVKQSELADSNKNSEYNSKCSSPMIMNGMNPVNKSMSLTFSSNNTVNESLFPSCVKRSTSLLDSIQKKNVPKVDSTKNRHKVDQLEQDLMQSLKDFDKMYVAEKNDHHSSKESVKYNDHHSSKESVRYSDHHSTKESVRYNDHHSSKESVRYNDHHSSKESVRYSDHHSTKESVRYNGITRYGTARRDSSGKTERKLKKEDVSNGNFTPNGKASNDSAYSSLNRISPSKLSLCTPKEPNGLPSIDPAPVGSDSSSHKDEIRSVSSEEFLAMERSAELDEPSPQDIHPPFKDEKLTINEKRASSRASSRRSPTWRGQGELSSSSSEASLHPGRAAPRLSRFCHECGTRFSVDTAKFCIECGVKRLLI